MTERAVELAEEMAKPFESCSLAAYWDCAGFPTNGWGNLLSRVTKKMIMKQFGFTSKEADEWLHTTWPDISQDEADAKFDINVNKAFASVVRLVKIPLSDEQLGALIDFAFNVGGGKLQASTLLRCVNRGEFLEAADQFLRWNKAGGIIQRGLVRRCKARRELFLSGTT